MIVREMTFHCAFKLMGTTGSMLRTFCVRLNGPTLGLMLFWNGTLTSDATGFCDALARRQRIDSTIAVVAINQRRRCPASERKNGLADLVIRTRLLRRHRIQLDVDRRPAAHGANSLV